MPQNNFKEWMKQDLEERSEVKIPVINGRCSFSGLLFREEKNIPFFTKLAYEFSMNRKKVFEKDMFKRCNITYDASVEEKQGFYFPPSSWHSKRFTQPFIITPKIKIKGKYLKIKGDLEKVVVTFHAEGDGRTTNGEYTKFKKEYLKYIGRNIACEDALNIAEHIAQTLDISDLDIYLNIKRLWDSRLEIHEEITGHKQSYPEFDFSLIQHERRYNNLKEFNKALN